MKINAITKLLKEYVGMMLLDDEERQHIVVGQSIYPMDGMPRCNEDTVLAVLSIPVGDREKYKVTREPLGMGISAEYVEDNQDSDREAELLDLQVVIRGEALRPLYTPYGMVLIREEERKPITDSAKTANYWARMIKGRPVIVVKNGFQLIAAIMPVRQWADEKATSWMQDVAHCAETLKAQLDQEKEE